MQNKRLYVIIKRESEVIFVRLTDFGVVVFYSPVGEVDPMTPIYPRERLLEISSCRSESVKKEKIAVWKLLEKAVREFLNLDFDNLEFTKTPNGKWICPEFYFSLSHSGDIIAVAISRDPVGVDVQKFRLIRQGLAERILTENELAAFESVPPDKREEFIHCAWAGKESAFKRDGGECLAPRQRETEGAGVTTFLFEYGNEKYVLAVAASDANKNIEIIFTEEI